MEERDVNSEWDHEITADDAYCVVVYQEQSQTFQEGATTLRPAK